MNEWTLLLMGGVTGFAAAVALGAGTVLWIVRRR